VASARATYWRIRPEQAHAPGQRHVGQGAVVLQFFKNASVDLIHGLLF